MQKITKPTKVSEIKRFWHQIDAGDQILGRVATQIVVKLMGKNKPYFVRNLDCGDYVVVTNSAKVRVTGKKGKQKIYTSFSGYPGGLRSEAFEDLVKRKPEEIIRRAVSGMLPKNKLRDLFLKRLYVYEDDKHPYADKFTK
jgi:large subunit ribosomal protein L13